MPKPRYTEGDHVTYFKELAGGGIGRICNGIVKSFKYTPLYGRFQYTVFVADAYDGNGRYLKQFVYDTIDGAEKTDAVFETMDGIRPYNGEAEFRRFVAKAKLLTEILKNAQDARTHFRAQWGNLCG